MGRTYSAISLHPPVPIRTATVTGHQLPREPLQPTHLQTGGPGTLACNSCHGTSTTNGMPDYANGTPKANSHSSHYNGYNMSLNNTCKKCHAATTSNGTSITNPANHVNKQYDLQAGVTTSFTYTLMLRAASCSSISCHGGSVRAHRNGERQPVSAAMKFSEQTCSHRTPVPREFPPLPG